MSEIKYIVLFNNELQTDMHVNNSKNMSGYVSDKTMTVLT